MSFPTQPSVIELTNGRGSNRSVILVDKNKRWLTRVRWSTRNGIWLISRGGPVALKTVIASAHDFEVARELAHKMALFGDEDMRTHPTPQENDILSSEELAQITEIMNDAETSARLNDWENEFCDSIRERILEYGVRARISAKQWEVIDRIEKKLYG